MLRLRFTRFEYFNELRDYMFHMDKHLRDYARAQMLIYFETIAMGHKRLKFSH